jgi:hypothetical protein
VKLQTKCLSLGFAAGVVVSIPVATVPTFLDWHHNPGGIFQDHAGTNWSIVSETFFSWLWPVFLVAIPTAVAVIALFSECRSSDTARQK